MSSAGAPSAERPAFRAASRAGWFYGTMLPLLIGTVLLATAVGSTELSTGVVARVLAFKLLPASLHSTWLDATRWSKADVVIVWLIRFPRVLVAAFVGAGLSVAGAIMQALFRNPLAEPGLVGAGSGAVLGGVVAFITGWSTASVMTLPISAMVGALLALVVVYVMATRGGVTPVTTLLLAGVAANALLGAVYSLLLSLYIINWQVAQEIVLWTMGGLEARTWTHVSLCAPFVVLGIVAALFQSRDLDLLLQGEETAASLGMDVENAKRMLTLTAAVLTGASVAVAGLVAFVGLVVPHGVRLLLGPSNRRLLPASALAGAVFLIGCDLLARTLHPPTEIRLGVVTSLVGGPLFIALLIRQGSARSV